MKYMSFFKKTATVLVIAVISLAGCKNIPEKGITMTTAVDGLLDFWMAGTDTAVIDRGDGSAPETVTLSASASGYTHTFSGTNSRTIAIDRQNITAMDCVGLGLTAFDVSKNTALRYLWCGNDWLTSLDVTKNTALRHLSCDRSQLTILEVSKNTALTHLWCYYNWLASLDMSNNTALEWLECYNNWLTSLDVSKNTALTTLRCQNNKLEGDGLNALFGTLHANTGTKTIYIRQPQHR